MWPSRESIAFLADLTKTVEELCTYVCKVYVFTSRVVYVQMHSVIIIVHVVVNSPAWCRYSDSSKAAAPPLLIIFLLAPL
jgi:hypothetical protein